MSAEEVRVSVRAALLGTGVMAVLAAAISAVLSAWLVLAALLAVVAAVAAVLWLTERRARLEVPPHGNVPRPAVAEVPVRDEWLS